MRRGVYGGSNFSAPQPMFHEMIRILDRCRPNNGLTISPRFYRASQGLRNLHRILCFDSIGPNVASNSERFLPLT